VSWISALQVELALVGIRGRTRRRIVSELADHLACDPESVARLGGPREVAERFASELRLVRTRRAAFEGFGALALTAGFLVAYSLATSAAGGWPDVFGARGLIVAFAGLGIVLSAQVAFVAGVLAVARHPYDAAEARLVQRRNGVALAAGATVAAAQIVQTVALEPLRPAWWFALALASGTAALVALGGSAVALAGARAVTAGGDGDAPGLVADLPPLLRRHARAVAPAAGIAAVAAMAVGSAIAEHSLLEGLTRGVLEGIAFVAAFVALGRLLGLRR
jgi:hypothetical protein